MIISNTEVATKNLCDKAHDFRFNKNLEPKKLPIAIYRGVLGHSALEPYYLEMKEGSSVDTCKSAALAVLDKEIARIASETPEEFEQISLVMNLRKLIINYARIYEEEPFRVLEVEKVYHTSVDDDIDYALRLDILVEMIKGEYRGDLVVVDHKFVYNFKTPLDIAMDAQLPKYIKALQDNGYTVTKGMFNQIRTRALKNPTPVDLYRREWVRSNRAETTQIWKEQLAVAKQIAKDKANPDYMPVRTLSLLVCRSCMFQAPCKAELNGDDTSRMLQANYKQSSYGYSDLSDA
jgi:hypothetical protein